MRFSTIVAFAAGVAVAVPAPEQIILNPQNDTSRPAARVSKDHESVNKAPPAVVYATRNLEDGSVTGWKCRENALHGDELRCTKERLATKSYRELIIEHYKPILSCLLLWGIFCFMVEVMIKIEAKALAHDIEMAQLEEGLMYDDYEMQSEEVVLFQYED
ncbi:hypothetical protein BBO_04491 [Beauveria brongniartii RCEF 3172]|uniref:Uncharacterized protein n=1 Tax=Beauveria brongniartii RCEF 3172 TaxID=1081107 RepID=A0A162JEZ9_9HYPO|nr:hypothetical protein BBO_04491 [Beauveria brongniartii RCEF 3172]